MIPFDKGTRDLLPVIDAGRQEMPGQETAFGGAPAPAGEFPHAATPSAMHRPADLPAAEDHADGAHATMPIKLPPTSLAAAHGPETPVGEAGGLHVISMSLPPELLAATLTKIPHPGAGDSRDHHEATQGLQAEPGTGDCASDGGHSIRVTQVAEVEQDASITVNGYVGDVVARLHIDQDLTMDQDVDISVTIDGDGHFAVLLDQSMHIDQETELDVNIYDEDGVLYVDVFLRDSIDVEQDTSIDIRISDGPAGGTVEVNQDIDLDQDVRIDIDIEDELEERYDIKLDVDVLRDVDAVQDAAVDISDWNGEIDMDVDAMQTAAVDQEIIVRADFALA
ncbi:hypothetical protein [Aminobacter sp. HY435]|uniref:hypothetical protein n=1 Tax=Aminobacter sp. HY435 TaxID=2970917 RepID=UPI0022B9A67D|nr:hypothetical protein [Aminobacter sp. HY435]